MTMRFGDGRDWFFEKRFGMFVHWGLYAIPAWHEQIQYRRGIPRREYEQLARQFNPVLFDPEAWLDLAEATGMGYITFTTKHIDGFCLWDTAETDYKVTNTPYGRDVLAMLADACHRRELPLCLYHSIVDNHHPSYPNQGRAHELAQPEEGDEPDLDRYMAYLKSQVVELCTNYGEIHGFWWDANRTGIQDPSINSTIRSLQPNAVINCRGFDDGDFDLFERDYRTEAGEILRFERPTEACQAVGRESWGFRRDEDYYTTKYLMQSIDRMMAKGANYLLNVGPMADGTIAPEDARILRRVGQWYGTVREAFDGAEPAAELTANREVLLTRRGTTLYVHLPTDPPTHAVVLNPLDEMPRRATLLNTGEELEARVELLPRFFSQGTPCLRIRNLPVDAHRDTVMVLKLEFDG